MSKICVIIPVLNEENNIKKIYKNIKLTKKKVALLFIDDNSNDKTREKIIELKKKDKNIYYIFRNNIKGIGSAHKRGIKWCFQKKFKKIITMDCDGTHNPKYFDKMIRLSQKFDLIITTRFVSKNSMKDWPYHRKILTNLRLIITKIILDLNYDASGAFRCFMVKKIKLKDITDMKSNNYDYFFESIYRLKKKKYSIKEVPIDLPYRKIGRSKMKLKHIFQSIFTLLRIRFLNN